MKTIIAILALIAIVPAASAKRVVYGPSGIAYNATPVAVTGYGPVFMTDAVRVNDEPNAPISASASGNGGDYLFSVNEADCFKTPIPFVMGDVSTGGLGMVGSRVVPGSWFEAVVKKMCRQARPSMKHYVAPDIIPFEEKPVTESEDGTMKLFIAKGFPQYKPGAANDFDIILHTKVEKSGGEKVFRTVYTRASACLSDKIDYKIGGYNPKPNLYMWGDNGVAKKQYETFEDLAVAYACAIVDNIKAENPDVIITDKGEFPGVLRRGTAAPKPEPKPVAQPKPAPKEEAGADAKAIARNILQLFAR